MPNGTIPIPLWSRSAELLRGEAGAILDYALEHPRVTPDQVSDMIFRTRIPRRFQALLMVRDRDELIGALRAVADGNEHPRVAKGSKPAAVRHCGYVFPGQGGQRPGMGRIFYDAIPAFRAEADRCAEHFHEQFGHSPLNYLLDESIPVDDRAITVQPALFTQMVGLAALWRSVGVEPEVTVGHSQGEIAAAYVSGAIALADAVAVVGTRAGIVDAFPPDDYAMAVVAAGRDTCEELIARQTGWAQVSVINSPTMVGISGDRASINEIVETLTECGVFARVIPVRYPAHTSMINTIGEQVREELRSKLSSLEFLDHQIGCIGGTLGAPITRDLPVDHYWFWNLRNTVRFDRAIAAATEREIDTFVELAEHPTLQLAVQESLSAIDTGRAARVIGTSNRTAVDLDEFTVNLANLAVHDLKYRWDSLRVDSPGPPSLPLRDFPNLLTNDVPLWLSYHQPRPSPQAAADSAPHQVTAAAGSDVDPDAGISAQLFSESWTRLTQRSLMPPRSFGIVDYTGDCADLAAALCSAAADTGATARLLDPETGSDNGDIDTIVVLLPRFPQMDERAAAAEVATFFAQRRWWPGCAAAATCYWLVTVGAEAVATTDAPPHLAAAAASAGFRSIGAEHPGVGFRHLDLSPESAHPESAHAIVTALHTDGEPELAMRAGALYAKRAVECDHATSDGAQRDHVVIIGGTGKLGLEFCEHFARRAARHITLISRSGETPAVAERLAHIRQSLSARIDVMSCDVRDEAAVSRLAEGQLPADLIIHAAVDYADIELADITTEKVDRALQAKVLGISEVLKVLPRTDNCRVVLCSSLAATIGGRGQIVYAAANRMLDAMAYRLRAEGLDCVSVQWGQWTVHLDLDASGIAKLAGTGIIPMRPADALAVGMNEFGGNTIVAAFDLARARPVLDAYGYGPLLSELKTPGPPKPTPQDRTPSVSNSTAPVSQRLTELLAEVIGADTLDGIDTTVPAVAIGLDSLQALEFHRRVAEEFDYELSVADLLGGASVDDVIAILEKEASASV